MSSSFFPQEPMRRGHLTENADEKLVYKGLSKVQKMPIDNIHLAFLELLAVSEILLIKLFF